VGLEIYFKNNENGDLVTVIHQNHHFQSKPIASEVEAALEIRRQSEELRSAGVQKSYSLEQQKFIYWCETKPFSDVLKSIQKFGSADATS